jgi:phosphatidate cytidylyltransferase
MTDDTGGKRPDNKSGLGADAGDDDDELDVDDPFHLSPGESTESVRIIGPVDEPPLRFGPDDTGPLPHWTEPPTGEVPRIFGDDAAAVSEDIDPWSTSSGSGPVWRDDRPGFETDDTIDFAGLGAGPGGGMDEQGTSSVDPFFDDEPYAAEPEQSRVTPIRTRRSGTGPVSAPRASREDIDYNAGGVAGRDLPMAVGVGIAVAAVAWLLLALGARYAMVLVVAILVVAGVEFYDKLREKGYQPATLAGLVAIAALPLAAYWKGVPALPLVMFLAVVVTMGWFILSSGIESGPLPNTAVTLLGVLYIGLLGSFAALILQFPNGTGTIFTLALGTVAYDIGGLFVGSSAGRTPLVAWISPNKTVEGLIGGVLAAFLVVVLVHFFGLHPWGGDGTSLSHALELGVVVAIAAPFGDLAESMLKRNLDIKDFGTMLPGHGGVLDRFDAFLFVLPAVYYLSLVVKVG